MRVMTPAGGLHQAMNNLGSRTCDDLLCTINRLGKSHKIQTSADTASRRENASHAGWTGVCKRRLRRRGIGGRSCGAIQRDSAAQTNAENGSCGEGRRIATLPLGERRKSSMASTSQQNNIKPLMLRSVGRAEIRPSANVCDGRDGP